MMPAKFFSFVLISALAVGCANSPDSQTPEADSAKTTISVLKPPVPGAKLPLTASSKIKNVIFMIGDGMGFNQVLSGQLSFAGAGGALAMTTMPVTGVVTTHSADNLITDSASGATAYSCGEKTLNRMIGMLPDEAECKTILEFAKEKGMATAVLSTSGITHATPASYYAHIDHRNKEIQIAEQLVEAGVNVALGGGYEFFIPSGQEKSKRTDSRNLFEEFEAAGYTVVRSKEELAAHQSGNLVGMFTPGGLTQAVVEPTLAELTSKALDIVSKDPDGFFMMVEGSQIDWGGHANDAAYAMREFKSFDDAIKIALEFAQKDGETLVIVTADHETGGMTMQKAHEEDKGMDIYWTTGYHTGAPVPVFAYGPKAMEFTGWWDNIEIGRKVAALMDISGFPARK